MALIFVYIYIKLFSASFLGSETGELGDYKNLYLFWDFYLSDLVMVHFFFFFNVYFLFSNSEYTSR